MRTLAFVFGFVVVVSTQADSDPEIDKSIRSAVVDELASRLVASYVIPKSADSIVQAVRAAQRDGRYDDAVRARQFVEKVNRTLRGASNDKHLRVYYDPAPKASASPVSSTAGSRERFNFGFSKLERLRGNVGYLEILTFEPTERAAETADALLGALANFDAIILDLRRNGGGNTPMVAFVASYFFGPTPVHLTDIYWRDSNETSQFWTSRDIPGRRSTHQPLYILTSASTFSGAEDFVYALQQLKRATIVGEQTGGGAHSGRGPQRLTPLFTAFIPTGRSINPLTGTNWEIVGVTPDIKTTAERAPVEAHLTALRRLLDGESDEQWKRSLRTALEELSRP